MRRTMSTWVWSAEEKWFWGRWVWSVENQSNGLRKATAASMMKPKETQSLDRQWNPRNPKKPRLVSIGWVLRWRTGRRRGSEAWIGGLGLRSAWADAVEADGGVGWRCWDREVRVTERERERERGTKWLREREPLFIILIGLEDKKLLFFV